MNSAEEVALRGAHSLYNAFEHEDPEDLYGDYEYDPYAEADQLYDEMGER